MDTWKMQLEYSRYLKLMAKRLNCVIILITQLNDDERVKYGQGIEENADYWIWWPWRDDQEKETGDVVLRLAKARHAKPGRVDAKFTLDVMRINAIGWSTVATVDANKEDGGKKESVAAVSSRLFSNAADY